MAKDAPLEPESVIQQKLIARARRAAAKHPEFDLLVHVPNGGVTSGFRAKNGAWVSRAGMRLKAMGQKRGFPDLFLFVPKDGYHGYAIEMKREGEKPKPHQTEVHKMLRAQGYKVEWFDDLEAAWNGLCAYLGLPLDCHRLELPPPVGWEGLGARRG